MIWPVPPASIGLAATMLTVSAAAYAGPIIPLQRGAEPPARILFDVSQVWDADDDGAAALDGDCVAVTDPHQGVNGFGAVSWTRARLSWEWDRAGGQSLVHVVCLDRRARWDAGSFGGGSIGSLMGAMSLAIATSANRAAVSAPLGSLPMLAQTSFEVGPTPFLSWPDPNDITVVPLHETPMPEPTVFDVPVPIPVISDGAPNGVVTPSVNGIGPIAAPAIINAAENSAPVPEPSTWLLIGTGLAALARRLTRP